MQRSVPTTSTAAVNSAYRFRYLSIDSSLEWVIGLLFIMGTLTYDDTHDD